MISSPIYHEFLVRAPGLEEAESLVKRFLDRYELVSYVRVDFLEKRSLPAEDPGFAKRLDEAVSLNRRILAEWVKELEGLGIDGVLDLQKLPQGYPSKLLHVIAHLLDGFFGVDSAFYNLVEDSHWVSPELMERIRRAPQGFWLVSAEVAVGHERLGLEPRPGHAL